MELNFRINAAVANNVLECFKGDFMSTGVCGHADVHKIIMKVCDRSHFRNWAFVMGILAPDTSNAAVRFSWRHMDRTKMAIRYYKLFKNISLMRTHRQDQAGIPLIKAW